MKFHVIMHAPLSRLCVDDGDGDGNDDDTGNGNGRLVNDVTETRQTCLDPVVVYDCHTQTLYTHIHTTCSDIKCSGAFIQHVVVILVLVDDIVAPPGSRRMSMYAPHRFAIS